VAAVFVLQLVLFQLAEEIGFTGFLQHHWQDRYHPMKLALNVALLWAAWHVSSMPASTPLSASFPLALYRLPTP
jgi:membrane protease YdiL (CAAX protease family)